MFWGILNLRAPKSVSGPKFLWPPKNGCLGAQPKKGVCLEVEIVWTRTVLVAHVGIRLSGNARSWSRCLTVGILKPHIFPVPTSRDLVSAALGGLDWFGG